jgi:uncharacterized coiled-coil protein SlyX
MEQTIKQLVENGAMGILAAVLLSGLIVFANWTRNYIDRDRKSKDERIKKLEDQVADLQRRFNSELVDMVKENSAVMENTIAMLNRMERVLERIDRKFD